MGFFDIFKTKEVTKTNSTNNKYSAANSQISNNATLKTVNKNGQIKIVNKSLEVHLKLQDEQLKQICKAEDDYKNTKDLDALVLFWENIWKNGGLAFDGSKWHFRLADLYIKQKRFDDAVEFCTFLKKKKSIGMGDYIYKEKAEKYILNIQERKEKLKQKKGNN